jgi:integrase
MSRIYKVGILHELVTKNPVMHVETRCKFNYRAIVITPAQTFTTLKSLKSNLHYTLGRHPVAGGADPDFETLGKRQRW